MLSRLLRLFRRRDIDYADLGGIVIGLGNPGRRYAATRHNVGFMTVDILADRAGLDFLPGRGDFHAARWSRPPGDVLLVKPSTYMNNSGLAAAQLLELSRLTPGHCLAISDDLDLPVGRIRLRGDGGAGGQRGLESLILHWDSDGFPRLRLGIGRPDLPTADYVLSPFTEEELDSSVRMVNVAADAVCEYLDHGLERSMSLFNRKQNT